MQPLLFKEWAARKDQIFSWAFNARDKVLDELSDPAVRYALSDGGPSAVVVFYGPSQVGKTTLLLKLLGVPQGEIFKEVTRVLRGESRLGDPATSTATVYDVSPDRDLYTYAEPGRTICSLTGLELEERLKDLRKRIEKSSFVARDFIRIGLPQSVISIAGSSFPITAVDLPGISSKRKEEHEHVRRLMERYLPVANPIIVVDKAGQMTGLQSRLGEMNADPVLWQDRLIYVLTYAATYESVKEVLRKAKKPTVEIFMEHVYGQLKKDWNGGKPPVRDSIFPVEYGSSWETEADDSFRANVGPIIDEIFSKLKDRIKKAASPYARLKVIANAQWHIEKKWKDKDQQQNSSIAQLEEDITRRREQVENIRKGIRKSIRQYRNLENKIISLDALTKFDCPDLPEYDSDKNKDWWRDRIRDHRVEVRRKLLSFTDRLDEVGVEIEDIQLDVTWSNTVEHAITRAYSRLNPKNWFFGIDDALEKAKNWSSGIQGGVNSRFSDAQKAKKRELRRHQSKRKRIVTEFVALWMEEKRHISGRKKIVSRIGKERSLEEGKKNKDIEKVSQFRIELKDSFVKRLADEYKYINDTSTSNVNRFVKLLEIYSLIQSWDGIMEVVE